MFFHCTYVTTCDLFYINDGLDFVEYSFLHEKLINFEQSMYKMYVDINDIFHTRLNTS